MRVYRASHCILCVASLSLLVGACQPQVVKKNPTDREYSSTQGSERAIIVFIHGILGNPDDTFRSERAQSDWPQMLAEDHSLNQAVRTLVVGYMSRPLERASNIHEIATRLQTRLRDRDIFHQFDKVIFVTHSMGGLIAKEMLLQIQRDDPALLSKVAGIFFLATPSGGSDLADMAKWLSSNPQFRDMESEDFNTYLQTIEDEWQAMLRRRNNDSPYPKSFCAYEKLPVGNIVVVPRTRSQFGCDEREIAFDRTHIDLVKPENTQDDVYQYVVTRIKKLLRDEYVGLRVSVALLSPEGQRIPLSAAMHSGESYIIEIVATRPAWFVVFARDSKGNVERYFPSAAAGDQATPSLIMRIPTKSSNVFVLDEVRGAEEIVVFATTENREDLRLIGKEVESSGAHAGAALDQALFKKGAKVSPVPKLKPSGDLQRIEAAGMGADATVRLVFWHD